MLRGSEHGIGRFFVSLTKGQGGLLACLRSVRSKHGCGSVRLPTGRKADRFVEADRAGSGHMTRYSGRSMV